MNVRMTLRAIALACDPEFAAQETAETLKRTRADERERHTLRIAFLCDEPATLRYHDRMRELDQRFDAWLRVPASPHVWTEAMP